MLIGDRHRRARLSPLLDTLERFVLLLHFEYWLPHRRGNVYAVWHGLAVGGANGEDHRLVWIARSRDNGVTFDQEQAWREPRGACGCCGLRLLAQPSKNLFLLFRSTTALTHRDIYLLESSNDGASFRGSQVQPWNIGACPMTSMSLAATGARVFGAGRRPRAFRCGASPHQLHDQTAHSPCSIDRSAGNPAAPPEYRARMPLRSKRLPTDVC
jgi:hypothetical protein